MLELYKNIKLHRKRLKMTQEELAARAGYTDRSSIAKIEKGVVDLPQSKIEQFANIFGIAASDLMGWDGNKEEIQKNNDLIADVVVRMRIDEEFCKAVEMLYKMDGAKIAGFNSMFGSQDK